MTTNTIPNLKTGQFQVRMPISALTHFIGFIAALAGLPALLIKASLNDASLSELICFTIFMFGMILMYSASTAYHTFNLSEIGNRRLKKFDHMMIPIMIAGSYTPICQLVLEKPSGTIFLAIIWSLAAAGIVMKALWVTCPRWVSSVIYIAMGWSCIFAIPMLLKLLPFGAFMWLLIGGIFYTVGGVVYALKLPLLEKYFKGFGTHELFHVFVMGGTFCHYMMMFLYLAN